MAVLYTFTHWTPFRLQGYGIRKTMMTVERTLPPLVIGELVDA
jgi:hypothetical protein